MRASTHRAKQSSQTQGEEKSLRQIYFFVGKKKSYLGETRLRLRGGGHPNGFTDTTRHNLYSNLEEEEAFLSWLVREKGSAGRKHKTRGNKLLPLLLIPIDKLT